MQHSAASSKDTFAPLVARNCRAIDLTHLAKQTLGDPALESEILALFVRQSRTLADRIALETNARKRRDMLHTLKGSARAVGAWQVARMAECLELLLSTAECDPRGAVHGLAASVTDAIAAIEDLTEAR